MVQGLLRRCEQLVVSLDGQARAVLRTARLRQLLCLASRNQDGLVQLELLLENLAMGGLPATFGTRDLLLGLKEFLDWMGRRGKLAPATTARLVGEVDACQEPFLDCFDDTESVDLRHGMMVPQ